MLIIPTYNEHDNIAVLVSRIRKAAGNEPVLFVDDNSPDGTADRFAVCKRRIPIFICCRGQGKGGYGSACRRIKGCFAKILRIM